MLAPRRDFSNERGVPERRLGAASLCLLLVLSACGDASSTPASSAKVSGPKPAASSDEVPAGHARMLALLEQIHEEARHTNLYLGFDVVHALRAQLKAVPSTPSGRESGQRFEIQTSLGREELRVGNTTEAIAALEGALGEIERTVGMGGKVPAGTVGDTHFQTGVAYMRLGETNNCCRRRTENSCILPIEGNGVHGDRDGSRKAIEHFEIALRNAVPDSPLHIKSRWLLNIAHMTLGSWPEGVQAEWRIRPDVFASDETFPRFPDVSQEVGVGDFMLAGGAVADDFDGDGLPDLMVSNSDTHGQIRLYRHTDEHEFEDVTQAAGLSGLYGGLNLIQADYDNDGDVDMFVLRGAWWRDGGRHPQSLLRNDGRGHFTDVTFDAGFGDVRFPTQTATWGDYDNDGDLDLYLGNESENVTGSTNMLFRNDGDGKFTDVAKAAGVLNERYTKAVHFGDYDEDGFPDIYVSNMAAENRLYHNNRDGTFTDVALAARVTRPIFSFPGFFWDFDQDGHLDIYAGGFGGPDTQPSVVDVASSYLGLPVRGEMPHLYQGDGKGHFADVAAEKNVKRYALAMGVNFGDLDNDGRPDLYLGTGYPFYEGLIPNIMYHNLGEKGFADVTTAGGFGQLQKGHGIVFADLDEDGDQDVFERVGGAYPGDGYSNVLFRNPGFGNHWLKVRLHGKRSNRFGVGARIALEFEEDGVARKVFKWVNSGANFGGNPMRQELGTGKATTIKTLEVTWPTSGIRQVFHDVAADQCIEVVEDEDAIRKVAR